MSFQYVKLVTRNGKRSHRKATLSKPLQTHLVTTCAKVFENSYSVSNVTVLWFDGKSSRLKGTHLCVWRVEQLIRV